MALVLIELTGFWPVWVWYVSRVVDGSDEPLGILALGSFLAIVWLRRGSSEAAQPGRRQSTGLFAPLGLSTALALAYLFTFNAAPALIRAVLAVSALAALFWAQRREDLALYGLLLISLPLISSLEFFLGYPLRLVLTRIVALILSTLGGLDVQAEGTLLNCAGRVVVIDAPCSGIQMLWVGLFINFLVAALYRLGRVQTCKITWFTLRVVLAANVLRTVVLFYKEAEIVPLPEWTHAAIGTVCFAGAALLIVSRVHRIDYA